VRLRAVALLISAGVVGLVILTFGPATKGDPSAVAIFGLACLLASTVAVPTLGYGLGLGSGRLISRLAKVPQIAQLIEEATAQSGVVESLIKQRAQLEQVITNEVRHGILLERRRILGTQASELVASFDIVDAELNTVGEVADPVVRAAIEAVRARLDARRRGDIILSLPGTDLVISTAVLNALPFGYLMRTYLEVWSRLFRRR
jgi:hypothetical protein